MLEWCSAAGCWLPHCWLPQLITQQMLELVVIPEADKK